MADSYLNKSGLSYFWNKIKTALGLKVNQTDFDALSHINRTLVPEIEIPANKDLNTTEYLTIGKYYVINNTTAATLLNTPPTGGKAFMLEVFSPTSVNIDNETTDPYVHRIRLATTYEGKQWYQHVESRETAGVFTYGSWQYVTNSGDVNNQIYGNINSKYGKVQVSTYTADSGKWVKIASMSHHARSNDNVNYTFRLDFTGSGTTQYRQSYTFGVGARMSNTALNSVRFDYLDSEKFNFNGAPEFEDLVKVTRKWVAGSSSADHYIYFEIWVHILSGWNVYWLHPTNMNYRGDYSLNQAFFRNSDEWAYSSISGTSAAIGQETYLTEGYEEVSMVDARKGVSYLDPFYTTRQTTADAPEIIGRGGIRTFVATASMSDRPADGNILHLDWDNTGGWDSQLLVSHTDGTGPNIYARGMSNGTWGDWIRFIREDDMVSKVNRNAFYNNSTDSVTYKKVVITGLPGATESTGSATYRGAGAFIFGRQQFYAISGSAGSENKTAFYEIGSNNNGKALNIGDMNLHIKAVYGGSNNPPKITLYVALERYGYCDIHSSGTITIEDSDSTEWEGVTADITCHPILASLKKASGGDLGNITAGADSQSYLEVKSITTATDIDTLKTTGLYIVGVTGCSNVPSGAGWGTIYVDWTIGTKYQIYINDGDAWKIWKRKWNSSTSSWGSWVKQVETADIKNGVLTIQKNGENVQTFSANQSSNVIANIEVPTKVSDIENDLNFIEDDTTQVCDEGSDIELEGTTKAPLEIKKLEGNTFQQSYTGKNLFNDATATNSYIRSNGSVTPNDVWRASQLIKVSPNTSYIWHGEVYGVNQVVWAGYDSGSALVSGQYKQVNNAPSLVIITGENTEYIRVGYRSDGMRNMQLELGSTATSFEPYVGGQASPSPEYPQSINTVTGRNVVEVVGKNLFDVETIPYVAKRAYGPDGAVLSWTDYAGTAEYQPVEPNTQYTLWNNSIGNTTYLCEYDENKNFIQRLIALKTFTTTATTKYLRWSLNVGTGEIPPTQTQLEKGSTATNFAPFSKQTYEINLGKNLLNKEDAVVGALLVNGTIDSTNYSNCRTTGYIVVKPNTAYCVSGRTTWSVQGEYTKDKTFISRSTGDSFTTGPNTYYVRVVCVNSELENMQFEAGSVATSYSDYFDPIELCRIITAHDYIHRNGNDFYIHREIGKYIFDGSETWSVNGNNWRTTNPITDLKSAKISDMGLSDKFIYWANVSGSVGTELPEGCFGFPQSKEMIDFRYSGVSTAADFKTWVENNTITVYYVKETPEEELITNEELISQLRDLWNATGYNDKTEISLLSYGNNSRAILSVCQYPNHIPVASQYKVGSVTVGDGLLVNDGGRISLDMSYIGTSIMKLSNSEIDTIMGVQ